jgi:hypothetical protein
MTIKFPYESVTVEDNVISVVFGGEERPKFWMAFLGVGSKPFDHLGGGKIFVEWLNEKLRGVRPLDGPLYLGVDCYFKRPASKKESLHTIKPGVDDLVSWIKDAGTGILWEDVGQIVSLSVRKRYANSLQATHITVLKHQNQDEKDGD